MLSLEEGSYVHYVTVWHVRANMSQMDPTRGQGRNVGLMRMRLSNFPCAFNLDYDQGFGPFVRRRGLAYRESS